MSIGGILKWFVAGVIVQFVLIMVDWLMDCGLDWGFVWSLCDSV